MREKDTYETGVLPLTAPSRRAGLLLSTHGDTGILLLLLSLRLHATVQKSFLDVARETREGLLDVDVALGGHLHEWDAELFCQRLTFFCCHAIGAALYVTFVANEDLVHTFGRMLFHVREPRSYVCGQSVSVHRSDRVFVTYWRNSACQSRRTPTRYPSLLCSMLS